MTGLEIMRAAELAIALTSPLLPKIAEALGEGLDEEAAVRKALKGLAEEPDLKPVLPAVRSLIADARKPKSER